MGLRGSLGAALVLGALLAAGPAGAEGRIAFLGQTGGYWQVWTMQPDGAGLQQLTHSAYEKSRVSWFPDGKRLLVVSGDAHLVEVDAESGREQPLPLKLEFIHDAAVSPDGRRLAVAASTGGGRDNHDIWIAPLDGGALRRLVQMPWLQHEPRWSPDGAWIYFVSGDGQQDHDIWRARVENGSKEQLTVSARYHFEVAVAPDGTLAFSNNRTGDYEIYARAPEGGELTRWTHSPGMDGHPSWSPDGKSLVFHSTRGGPLNLWRQAGPQAEARPLTHFEQGARAPEWWSGGGR